MTTAIKTTLCLGLWLLTVCVLIPAPPAQAQMAAVAAMATSDDTAPAGTNDLAIVADDVDNTVEDSFNYYQFLHDGLARSQARIAATINGLAAFPDEIAATGNFLASDMGRNGLLRILLLSGLFVAVGCLAEWLYRRATAPLCAYLEQQSPEKFADRFRQIAILCILSILSLGIFAIGSIGTFMLFDWPPVMRPALLAMLMAFFLLRIAMIILQFLFAPKADGLRMIIVDAPSASVLNRALAWAIGISLFAFAFGSVIQAAPTMQQADIILLDIAIVISVAAFCVATLYIARHFARHTPDITGTMEAIALPTRFAGVWPAIVCCYLIALGGMAMLGAARGFKTLAAIGLACLFDVILRNIIESQHRKKSRQAELEAEKINAAQSARSPDSTGEDFEPVKPTYPVFTQVLKRGVRLLALVLALASLWRIWGLDRLALSNEAGIVTRIIDASSEIIMILLIADLVWSLIKAVLDERINASNRGHGGDEGGGTGLSRIETLLPLLRNFSLTVIVIMVAMVTLSALGVDIGPLIAGAGVVGLALGFGSQALVRDVVAGVFFLLDDAFRLGEYIEVENLRGRVENISIRSMQLRHHRGPLQTIPFGEIKSIVNHSRDWVIVKLEFRVPFETDVNKVKKLVKKLSAQLLEDPLIGNSFIEPLKSQGVRRMEEFNMVIGLKYTAKPGEQFTIRKAVYQSVLAMFKENGIELASRNVKVDVPQDATPEQKQEALAAAAQQVSEQQAKAKS